MTRDRHWTIGQQLGLVSFCSRGGEEKSGESRSKKRDGITEVKRRGCLVPVVVRLSKRTFVRIGPLARPSALLSPSVRLPCCREYLPRRAGTTPSIATPNRRRSMNTGRHLSSSRESRFSSHEFTCGYLR